MIPFTEGGVFSIHHDDSKDPVTVTGWKKLVEIVGKANGDIVDDRKMTELLREGRSRSVYLSNADGLSPPRSASGISYD